MGKFSVTFTDETERKGGKSFHFPEGEYGFQIVKGEIGKAASGNRRLSCQLKCIEDPAHKGKYKGKTLYDNHTLVAQSLWSLRAMLEAAGVKIRSGAKVAVDTDKLKNLKFGATVEDDEYEQKVRSKISDWYPLAELKDRAVAVKADEELDDDEEEEEEEEVEETEEDEEDLDGIDLDDI